jgi:purine-binding chemotaxis protein CheW
MSEKMRNHDVQDAGIDRMDIHQRLEAVSEALENGNSTGGQDAREILKARAAALAKPVFREDCEGERVDVLEFLLAGEAYAIEASFIRETVALVEFTPLFCTPPFVLGITNVRGRIVSVVDMRIFFDRPAGGLSNLNRLIIVSDGCMEFGILADSIIGTIFLPVQELQAPAATLTGIRDEFLRGVTGDRLALLDMGRILADKRLIVHDEVE